MPSLAATESANSAFGRISAFSASSAAMRASRSLSALSAALSARAMSVASSSSPSLATYAPSLRMDGITSSKTHASKRWALSSLLLAMRRYMSPSVMKRAFCSRPRLSLMGW